MAFFVVKINFGHWHIDILINSSVSKNHEDFSFFSEFINNVPVDIRDKDMFTLVFETEVHKDLLEHIELLKLVLGMNVLISIVKSLNFILSNFFKIVCSHACILSLHLLHEMVLLESSNWNELSKDQELDILIHSESCSECFDKAGTSYALDFVFTIHLLNLHKFSN